MQKRMGAQFRGEARTPSPPMGVRLALPFLAAALWLLAITSPARASFHLISIREVYPGSIAQPQSSYVELQMYEGGQNFVVNQSLTLYSSTGTLTGTFTFGSSLPGNGSNQQTILIGDSGVQAALGVTPDLESSSFNVPASGGAACWAGSIDCVAWGSFTGSTASPVGTPVDQATGIPDGMAVRRSISGGTCTNLLDAADDTNDSATDFSNATPAPQSYATVPTSMSCVPPLSPPSATIISKPGNPTQATSASFTYQSTPSGATFECRLDIEAFAGCESSGKSYAGPLSQGSHTFQVRATNGNGTGSPASYTWTIDTTAPTVTIDAQPKDPSPGASSTFKFHASETVSKFECSLAKGAQSDLFSTCSSPKTYSSLLDGSYTFKVRATDKAGNQSTPEPFPTGTFTWTVDNSLADTTPPETTILSRPPDPSGSPAASFTYASNEPSSTFECTLDGAGFAPCPAAGIAYAGLANGPHTFQVRAIDPSNNTDPSPAGYSFDVVLGGAPLPPAPGAPQTSFSGRPLTRTHDRTPTFRFRSSAAGATFQCKLDGGPFKACRSPFTTKPLSFDRHILKIRAVLRGTADPTPSIIRFKVQRP